MILLAWELHVKFRAFGITFGQLDEKGSLPVVSSVAGLTLATALDVPVLAVNKRGVSLSLRLTKVA